MFVSLNALIVLVGAVAVQAHVDINWPKASLDLKSYINTESRCQAQYNFTEEQQETGALCGGGTRAATAGWGSAPGNAFVSLSGDPGQKIRVKLLVGPSQLFPPNETRVEDFNITLVREATFPDSGNFCVNVSIPNGDGLLVGAFSTLYAEAVEPESKANVSACAAVALIPGYFDINQTAVVHAKPAQDESGRNLTNYEYFCSNSTILARETCDCHCHGDHEHCTATCSDDQVKAARAQCEIGTTGSGSSTPASVPTASSLSPSNAAAVNAHSRVGLVAGLVAFAIVI